MFGFFETVQFAVVGTGLHRSPAFLGVLTAAQGGGAVIGGLLAAPVLARTSERLLDFRILLAIMAVVMLAAAGYLARVPGSPAGTATRDIVTASNRVQR